MKLLDLFCGAGGASMGYYWAGFDDITGVDLYPQPHYPFKFIQADATAFPLDGYDLIHCSPPCQRYSIMTKSRHRGRELEHPDLVAYMRNRFWSLPYVIENVPGAPLVAPALLCGSMFDLNVRRHRLFECSFYIPPMECYHELQGPVVGVYGHTGAGANRGRARARGETNSLADWRAAMDIDWMNAKEIAQAVPPAYTQFIGEQAIREITLHRWRRSN